MSTAEQLFYQFSDATTFQGILNSFRDLCSELGLENTHYGTLYPALKEKLTAWKCQELWKLLDKRASLLEYDGQNACAHKRVCVIGAGPIGLRTAIEAALLGAKVDVLEKRTTFSRNNVLHLWPFLITDLRNLGAKRFYPKFCAGAIDHISIRVLQCMLLKVCLLLGIKIFDGVEFCQLLEPSGDKGWMIGTSPSCAALQHQYDIIVGADGKKYCLPGFKAKEFRAKLAIAITVNFVNHNTTTEASVEEISGVSYIYNQDFFNNLRKKHDIDLENIVYYKDETHYFVMTAKKQSLLKKGVLKQDKTDPSDLLSSSNIDRKALMTYSKEAAHFSTKGQLCVDEFVINEKGIEDVALFDFTSLFAAENAARIVERKGKRLLMCLVGDSLLEPFWPTGSGCARGFLGAFDAAWMMKGFAANEDPLKLLEEREAIHLLLPQTTSEKIHKNYAAFTINPSTRYPNLSGLVPLGEVASLYDTGTGPIKSVQRTQPVVTKTERRPAVLAEAANRKRSKDDFMIHDRSELLSKPRDALKNPRVADALPTDASSVGSRSPKSKPKVKSEGRSFFHPALKPKPTITSSDDLHVHKITHKKKTSKQLPMDSSVTLLSHTKVTDKDSNKSSGGSSGRKKAEHKGRPAITADKPIVPSSSHSVNMAAPPVSSYSPSHSRDRSPPPNEVNVLKMKASFEQRDLEAKNSASLRQRISRRSTAGSKETSTARIPKSASFSDLQDPQLQDASAFPSSNPQPVNRHRSRRLSTGDDHKTEPSKDHKEPLPSKHAERSTFMKWLREPHKQVIALVSNIVHSGSYSPKDQTDCGDNSDDNEATYKLLPEENNMSATPPATPPPDETLLPSPDKLAVVASTDQETSLDVTEDTSPEKQNVPVESTTLTLQESLSTEDQGSNILEQNTTKGDTLDDLGDTNDALDDVRVRPLIAKLEPAMENNINDATILTIKGGSTLSATKGGSTLSGNQQKRHEIPVTTGDGEMAAAPTKVEPLWLAKLRSSLSKCLERLRRGYDIVVAKTALEILFTITSNVEHYPNDDNYRRVRISSEQFSSKVWDYPCCQDFLTRAGWMEIDDFIVVPLRHQLTTSLAVIQKHLDIVNNMIWSLQIELPEPEKPTVMEKIRRQQKAKLARRQSYTSEVVDMATEMVAKAAYHQKQRRSVKLKRDASRSDSEREESMSPSPEPLADVDDRVEEQTTIKAAKTARRVWLKRLAHNTFSKPEQHWRPKLEAELYDIEQLEVVDTDAGPFAEPRLFLQTSAREDGLTGEEELKMMLARRHTISNAMRTFGITSGSSSERSSLSPPPSDVTPSASHSDFNSEEILSDVTSDHDNKAASYLASEDEELTPTDVQPHSSEEDSSKDNTLVVDNTQSDDGVMCQQELKENDTSDKENKQQAEQEQDEMNSLDQHELAGHFTKQELSLDDDERETEGCEVVTAKHGNGSHGNHHHWKQDERMVLEAGSKAAEIAKNVFGK